MAWLEAHQELADHPKTKRAARQLDVSIPTMIGHLLCLWWWSMDYAQDGDLSDFEDEDVADAARWEGDAAMFVDALVHCGTRSSAGFLDSDRQINDWDDYGGKYLKRREMARERQRKKRKHDRDDPVSHAPVTRDIANSSTVRGQESREEDNKSAPKPARARSRPKNPIWDALVDECGAPTTRSEESDLGKTVKEMKEAQATPEAIHAFASWWVEEMPAGTMLTHRCYRDHWSKFLHGLRRASGQAANAGRPMTRQEREMQEFINALPPQADT